MLSGDRIPFNDFLKEVPLRQTIPHRKVRPRKSRTNHERTLNKKKRRAIERKAKKYWENTEHVSHTNHAKRALLLLILLYIYIIIIIIAEFRPLRIAITPYIWLRNYVHNLFKGVDNPSITTPLMHTLWTEKWPPQKLRTICPHFFWSYPQSMHNFKAVMHELCTTWTLLNHYRINVMPQAWSLILMRPCEV